MSELRMRCTTEIRLVGANGELKPLWNENKLGRFLRRICGIDSSGIGLAGRWGLTLSNSNTITDVGHAAGNGRISNQGSYSPFVNLAIGTGTQGAPTSATALATEITTSGGARGSASATQVTTAITNDTTQLVKTWTFSASFAITEEGIFDNASSGGTMLAYQSFSAINVISTDQLTITHKYQT